MAFASFDSSKGSAPMAEINMVPLIDVMLVLLVIFMVTAPLLTHAVRLELPQASAQVNQIVAEKVEIAIDGSGTLYWNGEVVDRQVARERFAAAGSQQPRPEVHLRADAEVPYRFVARTLADATAAGLTQVAFVSQPELR